MPETLGLVRVLRRMPTFLRERVLDSAGLGRESPPASLGRESPPASLGRGFGVISAFPVFAVPRSARWLCAVGAAQGGLAVAAL